MLSHIDPEGRPTMVDVGAKEVTTRTATARARVRFPAEAWSSLVPADDSRDLTGPKGPIFATAIVAGIQGAKRTWELIPMCHPLPLDKVEVVCTVEAPGLVEVRCTARATYRTGVEMEALTGASVAALTIYDMTKALSHAIVVESVELLSKTGGKSDHGPR